MAYRRSKPTIKPLFPRSPISKMFTTALLVAILVPLLIVYLYKSSRLRHKNFPPGPPRLPIWGSYWFMLKENYKFPHLSLDALGKRYNTDILGVYLGNFPTIVTLSTDLCKEVLTRDEFLGRNDTIIVRARGRGQLRGIFFIDGPYWKGQRRFSLRHLRDFGFGRRSQKVENFMLDEIKSLIHMLQNGPTKDDADICRGRGEVLVPEVFVGPLLNAQLMILTSSQYNHKKLREIGDAVFRFNLSGDVTGNAISQTPWLRYIAPGFFGYTSAIDDIEVQLQFLKENLDEHIRTFSDDHHRDFIDVYISETLKYDQEGLNDFTYHQLLYTLLDYMFPVANAIGHTLSTYFANLINHPEVQVKIQAEIDAVVGTSRLPNLDDKPNMPYTEATIRESIRFFPNNPLGIPRRCLQDTTLGGYAIPKDTIILPCVWSAHKDERVWKNPNQFLPERFLDQAGNLIKKDLTLGFGAGKRLCAGETFARHNMFLIVAGVLQNFTIRSPDGKPVDFEKRVVPSTALALEDNWVVTVPR